MRASVVWLLQIVDVSVLTYFVIANSLSLLFAMVAFAELRRHRHKWTSRELGTVMRSPVTPGISVVVPARDEESTIHERIRSFLRLNFPQFEVVVVNDGSTDRTLDAAIKAFDLMRAPVGEARLDTQSVRGVYRSLTNSALVVIDKQHGGRADAINAGINAARYPLVCVIGAASLLDDDALTRAVMPFVEDPATVAAGGIVRVANGCRVEHGRVTRVGLPTSRLAMFQVVEYLRTFLVARVAQSAFGRLPALSDAFGLFRRDVVIEAGGFRTNTIGQNQEIVTRLRQVCLERGTPCRIVFQPDSLCWTDVPESIRVLARQRNTRQQDSIDALGSHAPVTFNARPGMKGLLALPYELAEAVGPVVELLGYVLTAVAVVFGFLDWRFARLLFLAAVLYGAIISLTAVLLQELSSRRYPRVRDLLRLAAYGVLENFGYRQLTAWWRVAGILDRTALAIRSIGQTRSASSPRPLPLSDPA